MAACLASSRSRLLKTRPPPAWEHKVYTLLASPARLPIPAGSASYASTIATATTSTAGPEMSAFATSSRLSAIASVMPVKAKALSRPYIGPTNWTGFYAGGFLGVEYGKTDMRFANDPIDGNNPRVFGALGGIQVGYNYQTANRWVFGVEADIGGTNLKEISAPVRPANNVEIGANLPERVKLDRHGGRTGRLRVGTHPVLRQGWRCLGRRSHQRELRLRADQWHGCRKAASCLAPA